MVFTQFGRCQQISGVTLTAVLIGLWILFAGHLAVYSSPVMNTPDEFPVSTIELCLSKKQAKRSTGKQTGAGQSVTAELGHLCVVSVQKTQPQGTAPARTVPSERMYHLPKTAARHGARQTANASFQAPHNF